MENHAHGYKFLNILSEMSTTLNVCAGTAWKAYSRDHERIWNWQCRRTKPGSWTKWRNIFGMAGTQKWMSLLFSQGKLKSHT